MESIKAPVEGVTVKDEGCNMAHVKRLVKKVIHDKQMFSAPDALVKCRQCHDALHPHDILLCGNCGYCCVCGKCQIISCANYATHGLDGLPPRICGYHAEHLYPHYIQLVGAGRGNSSDGAAGSASSLHE